MHVVMSWKVNFNGLKTTYCLLVQEKARRPYPGLDMINVICLGRATHNSSNMYRDF